MKRRKLILLVTALSVSMSVSPVTAYSTWASTVSENEAQVLQLDENDDEAIAISDGQASSEELLGNTISENMVGNAYDASRSSATFYAVDSSDQVVHSVSKADGEYLFLPNNMDLSAVRVFCKYDLKAVEGGYFDEASKTIVVDAGQNISVRAMKRDGSVLQLKLMHSNLPSLQLSLHDVALSTIHAGSKSVKYKNNSLTVTDPNHAYDLVQKENVELKGRGNSSWRGYGEKRPYQIKFEKKQSLLGMEKAKKWILLANAADPTMMKNAVVYETASRMDLPFVPDCRFADLWIDGSYRGTYLVTEKNEIGSNRLDLSDQGVIAEFDNMFYKSEATKFKDLYGNYFTLHDPDADEVGSNFAEFEKAINQLERAIDQKDWKQVSQTIDVESFAKWYVISEYFSNNESCSTSCFFYRDGAEDVIHAGPLWDFDTCMDSFNTLKTPYYMANHPIYGKLLKMQGFKKAVSEEYGKYQKILANSDDILQRLENEIKASADMNYRMWETLGKKDIKGHWIEDSFDKNVRNTEKWLQQREKSFEMPYRSAMYRLYNPNSGEHFYTANAGERKHLISVGWKAEGIGWYAPAVSAVPVYRLYNPNAGDHHYTTNASERNMLKGLGWNDEGIGWYSDEEKTVALYRQYNPNAQSGAHNFTINAAEREMLKGIGWKDEGTAWYGIA